MRAIRVGTVDDYQVLAFLIRQIRLLTRFRKLESLISR